MKKLLFSALLGVILFSGCSKMPTEEFAKDCIQRKRTEWNDWKYLELKKTNGAYSNNGPGYYTMYYTAKAEISHDYDGLITSFRWDNNRLKLNKGDIINIKGEVYFMKTEKGWVIDDFNEEYVSKDSK